MKNKCNCICHALPKTPLFKCEECGCITCLFCNKTFTEEELEKHYFDCRKEYFKHNSNNYMLKKLFVTRVSEDDKE